MTDLAIRMRDRQILTAMFMAIGGMGGARYAAVLNQNCVLRLAMAAAFIVLAASAVQADHIDRVIILEAGLYSARITHRSAAPHDPAVAHEVERASLQQRTTVVPGRIGIWFGLRYRVAGKPQGAAVPLRMITRFPPPGIRYPGTWVTRMQSESIVQRHVGEVAYRGFHFDHPVEIVPGLWAFEFWQGNTKLGEQQFCVIDERLSSGLLPDYSQRHDCPDSPTS